MKPRLLDYDPVTGIKKTFQYDEITKKSTVKTEQYVDDYLKDNTELRNSKGEGWKGEMHHVASIPLIVVEQWWKELGSDPFGKENRAWLIARLNSRDWCKLRTKEGTL